MIRSEVPRPPRIRSYWSRLLHSSTGAGAQKEWLEQSSLSGFSCRPSTAAPPHLNGCDGGPVARLIPPGFHPFLIFVSPHAAAPAVRSP